MFKKAILSTLVSAALVAPALAESIVGYNGSTPGVFQPQNKLFIPGNKPLLPRLPSGSLKPACPDLAVNISQRDLGSRGIEISYAVTNVGRHTYRSSPNQQALHLSESGRLIRNHPFTNLAPGASAAFSLIYRPGGEFSNRYNAYISLDPDIGYDSNSANDDCRLSNNQASLTTLR